MHASIAPSRRTQPCVLVPSPRSGDSEQLDVTDAVDVAELYPLLARRLERIVHFEVHASDAVIEEACQFAWTRLVLHADRVHRDRALAWLATTARHEALYLLRCERRQVSLEATLEAVGDSAIPGRAPSPHELCEQRERIASVSSLPARQQRALWLHAAGYTYAEISGETGDSLRTVERLLLRAKHAVRALAAA
jgi:RNA polymerase sigma factor (sigma-70 family)